jgi:phosphomannomutase
MPEPIAENLDQLCAAVKQARADVGFAQDPDADRLVVVDETGSFIGEEYTLPLAAQTVLSGQAGPLAANLSTSRLIDEVARRAGCTVYRTPVGEAHVAQEMIARGCVFGGEGNGGVIDPRVVPVRDSFVAIALICQLIVTTGKTISGLVADLPRYAMVKRKFPCDAGRACRVLELVRNAFAGGHIDDSDGVRVDLPDGWVHVRASNTEPIMRIIAEAREEEQAVSLCDQVERVAAEAG